MVNPGAFRGPRKEFLMGEKENYSQAVDNGYVPEAVAKIQRRFFKRFPIDLPDEVDPTPEELAAVNDEAIDPDYPEPDPEKMTSEEYVAEKERLYCRQRKIAFRKSQIKRWLAYQYMKDHDIDSKSNGAHNPYRALLFKLTGQEYVRPRAKTACNVWRKTEQGKIEEKVKVLAAEKSVPRSGLAALRDKVAKEMFSNLLAEERRKWQNLAQEESTTAQRLWKEEVSAPASTSAQDRQNSILGLVRFMQPILDLVCEATGWKALFIAGGPEPAHGGRLNVISIHSGKTAGDIPLDFGALERENYRKVFIPMYGHFLKKCYSVEECRARALSAEDSFPLEVADVDGNGADLFSIDDSQGKSSEALFPTSHPSASSEPCPPSPSSAARPPSTEARPPSPLTQACPPSPAVSQPPSRVPSPASAQPPSPSTEARPPSPLTQACPPSPVVSQPPSRVPSPASVQPPSPVASVLPLPAHSPPPASCPTAHEDPLTSGGSSIPQRGKRSKRRRSVGNAPEVEPPKKRQKASDIPRVTSPIVATSDAPKWFSTTLLMLQSRGLDEKHAWMNLVRKWAAFEELEGYEEKARLSSTSRPDVIGSWIQRRRSPTYQPTIKLASYSKAYMNWWTAIQPEWRVADEKIDFDKVEGDWEELRKPGLNGLVSVLVGLFFWGCMVKEDRRGSKDWELAVNDCLVALTHIISSAT